MIRTRTSRIMAAVAQAIGMDPVQLGIMMVVNLAIGLYTPPVGTTLFITSALAKVKVGQKVLSIGNPFGFERSLSTGIVSRLDFERDRIQTDAAINPGCSGGPLLDTRGNVIGINVAIFNPNKQGAYVDRTNIGIGFAVPVNTVKDFLRELASEPAIPATVAAISKKPVVRYIPPGRDTGYENVSVILQRFSGQN